MDLLNAQLRPAAFGSLAKAAGPIPCWTPWTWARAWMHSRRPVPDAPDALITALRTETLPGLADTDALLATLSAPGGLRWPRTWVAGAEGATVVGPVGVRAEALWQSDQVVAARRPGARRRPRQRLVEQVASRVTRWLAKRGFGEDEPAVEDDPDDAGLLLQAASAAGCAALGRRAGRRAQRIRTVAGRVVRLPPRCAALDGYNVHAGVVVGGHDVEAVERLCRYVCRPALAKGRIEEAPGRGVVLRFKRPWSDETPPCV